MTHKLQKMMHPEHTMIAAIALVLDSGSFVVR